eukprot:TRINITY_DN13219_c0_g1_i1.p1 TRINITY_DN13219_c0_g1~~TRINITY_DN13219_c0_g1_i1.p1  ORF type:complete len:131 (-),score=14.69 TRINITY_DN13219_c0_g1_i1:27-419(-)
MGGDNTTPSNCMPTLAKVREIFPTLSAETYTLFVRLHNAVSTNHIRLSLDPHAGIGVFEHFSRFNHSCSPNCTVHIAHSCLDVVTTSAVVDGDELTVSYLPAGGQGRAQRKDELRKGWGFDCDCPQCQDL